MELAKEYYKSLTSNKLNRSEIEALESSASLCRWVLHQLAMVLTPTGSWLLILLGSFLVFAYVQTPSLSNHVILGWSKPHFAVGCDQNDDRIAPSQQSPAAASPTCDLLPKPQVDKGMIRG